MRKSAAISVMCLLRVTKTCRLHWRSKPRWGSDDDAGVGRVLHKHRSSPSS